jgi:hypothetical protein
VAEQLLPAGPVPLWVAWFFAVEVEEWRDAEDARRGIQVSPVIGWVHDVGAGHMPIPLTHDGEIRGPDMLRFVGLSAHEARNKAQELALHRFRPSSGTESNDVRP